MEGIANKLHVKSGFGVSDCIKMVHIKQTIPTGPSKPSEMLMTNSLVWRIPLRPYVTTKMHKCAVTHSERERGPSGPIICTIHITAV